MTAFRTLLVILLIAVVIYTIPVVIDEGSAAITDFFGDILAMTWPGQFNFDFLVF